MAKYFKNLIPFFLLLLSLTSCSSAYEKHMDEFNDCVKEKRDKKKYKYGNIQEAINVYDFAIARDYLACHPSRTETNSRIVGSDFKYPYQEDLRLIVESEVAFYIAQGEFQKAEATAKEAGTFQVTQAKNLNTKNEERGEVDMVAHFQKLMFEASKSRLDELLSLKQFSTIYDLLSSQRVVVQSNKYRLDEPIDFIDNKNYNDQARKYNSLVDKVLTKYKYLKVDKKEIREVLDLSAPELEFASYSNSSFADKFKKEAIKKYLK